MPADNGRFGASGGVARPTLECRTATFRSRPNRSGIPRLPPSRWDVRRHFEDSAVKFGKSNY